MDEIKSLTALKRALRPIPKERRKAVACALVGHSRIVSLCFGYVYCGRCEAQIGDKLGGAFDTSKSPVVGHACDTCRKNMEGMTWRDTYLSATIDKDSQ